MVILLEENFDIASTIFRLFLEKSKDEYASTMREIFDKKLSSGKTGFIKDKQGFVEVLQKLNLIDIIQKTKSSKYTWKDIIIERLKSGRGSAIKGQKRGRVVEDFVERIVKDIFDQYDVRCSFVGRTRDSTEKADFAIPSKQAPRIVIEVKAYGATGSKQSDVIGDVERIIDKKRHDTIFILVTDGVTWHSRQNDLRKLVKYQNEGYIYRIYTTSMVSELRTDLLQIKEELSL